MSSGNDSSKQTGQGVGDAIKGIFNAGHGAGESIRGTINSTLDSFGAGIASDGKTTSTGSTDTNRLNKLEGNGTQDHQSTIEKGKEEVNSGINSISNAGN